MMKNKLTTAITLSLSLTLLSCSDDANKTEQAQTTAPQTTSVAAPVKAQSAIMSFIPAETPVLMLYAKDPNYPLPEKMLENMGKVYANMGDILKMSVADALSKSGDDEKSQDMAAFVDKWFSEDGLKKLGLSLEENEFAVYAIDLFPVARITLAKTHSMGEVLDELMTKANEKKAGTSLKKEMNGATVYQFGDNEGQLIISLDGNSVALSFAPTSEVDNLMPTLLGFEKPSRTLVQSAQYNDTISQYNYLGNSVYWLNFRDLADYFVNPANYDSAMLDMMKIQDNMLSADCKTEILGMVDKFPRLVGGTTVLNDSNMNSHMILELTDGIGSKLAKMHGRIPVTNNKESVTYGFSFDIAAAKDVALEFVTNIETDPFKCELMADMNAQASMMKTQLSQPLPPFVGNFKGVNMVIDELDLDMTKTDPNEIVKSIKGKLLLAVDNPEALQGMAMMAMPDLQKLGLKVGGEAVNVSHMIPLQGTQIPINMDHVFVAMGSDTIGMSLGEGTDPSLTQDVSSESKSHLLSLNITSGLYKSIFDSLSAVAESLPLGAQNQVMMQQSMMTNMLWWQSQQINLDFTDRGFEIGVDVNY
ncbi:MAG: hypothetical protein AB8B80_00975 [Marinicellaceae bacterium]